MNFTFGFRNESPLVIIYQNTAQRERMKTLAKNVVFLDATYKGWYISKNYHCLVNSCVNKN